MLYIVSQDIFFEFSAPENNNWNTPKINLLIMKNLMLTIKNSFLLINNNGNENLQLSNGMNGETLEYFNDEGVKKVFNVHHYSNGNTILFKNKTIR